MFAIVAALMFILAAFGVQLGTVNLLALGLCSLAIHLLVGAWPFSSVHIGRRPGS